MVSTLAGIPMKYSGKLATVVKGQLSAKISGLSQLLKSQYKEIKASVSTSSKYVKGDFAKINLHFYDSTDFNYNIFISFL